MGISLAYYFAALSLITLVLYAVDKLAAKKRTQRISERTLHLVALLGGWPGALLGQILFHHKTKKQPFRMVFWLTIIANVSVFIFLGSPSSINPLN